MDLESGRIFWPATDGLGAEYPPLRADARCEIAVIGGGISGALAAYHLAEAGAEVLLLDKRAIAHGSTAATTGLLLYEIDTPLVELAGRIGEAAAARCYRLCLEANRAFGDLAREIGDSCDLRPKKCLYLASEERDVEELRREGELRRRHGLRVDFLGREQVAERFSLAAPAALLSYDAAEIDAYRFTFALLRTASGRGLRVYAGTEVTGYEADADGVLLTTGDGFRVAARRVIFATGYESQQYLRRRGIVELHSTYVIASQRLERFDGWGEDRCLIWETARPYVYVRDTPDGRAMVGGGDEPFQDPQLRDRLIPAKAEALRRRFAAMFPHIDVRPEYAWAGTFGTTRDGLPYIGRADKFPLGFFALGFGGNGVTFSLVAARIIRDLYRGTPNADAALFRFDRGD